MPEYGMESLLYKTRQHWLRIVPPLSITLIIFVIPVTLCVYFLVQFSFVWTGIFFMIVTAGFAYGYFFFWQHSWISITNQKCIISLADGWFSYSRLTCRLDDIREVRAERHSLLGMKYGTLFVTFSSARPLSIAYIPRIGEVQSLLSILTRYTAEERSMLRSIRALHEYHMKQRKYVG